MLKNSICVFYHYVYNVNETIYLLSGSNLHSLFLWPQNCTCLQIIDPETENRQQPPFKKRTH